MTERARTVLVVDDHELVATALMLTLRADRFDAHRSTSCRVENVLATAQSLNPGIVLLDLDLADAGDGAALVPPLRTLGWDVLVVTGTSATERIGAAVVAGAAGWVSKSTDFTGLLTTVHDLAAGRPVTSPAERAELVNSYQDSVHRARQRQERRAEVTERLSRLSRREREVLECLAEGSQAGTIAEEFVVSLATVRAQIRSILAKLDVGSQLAATALLHRSRE